MLLLVLVLCGHSMLARQSGEPANPKPEILPVIPENVRSSPLARSDWGGDATVTDAYVFGDYKGQIVSVADTVGGIYVAVNEVYLDTLSRIMVYRSTDGGSGWTLVNGFRNSKYPIGSFDMCIADSSGANWVIGIAFSTQADDGTVGVTGRHGGSLYYGTFLADGTHWRVSTIAAMTTSTCYREPSICSNAEGTSVGSTRHFVAAVKVSRADNQGWKMYVNSSTNWGDTWADPDTTIAGEFIEYPTIDVDWSSTPDTLCVAFTSFEFATNGYSGRDVCVARNTYSYSGAWGKTVLGKPTNDICPSMAMDHSNGDMIISYSRDGGGGAYDAMYFYSVNHFTSYVSDSIENSANQEIVTAVTCYLSGSDHCWRVAYATNAGNDSVYIKSITNKLNGFHSASRLLVSQFRPDLATVPSIGAYRRSGGSAIGLYCVYVGRSSKNVYFDASGLSLTDIAGVEQPTSCTLLQNYPNPFNPITVVSCQWSVAGRARLAVYDLLGREVAVLLDEWKEPGKYEYTWDARNFASGFYICRMEAGSSVLSRKMALLR
jgi:hypothetical protein